MAMLDSVPATATIPAGSASVSTSISSTETMPTGKTQYYTTVATPPKYPDYPVIPTSHPQVYLRPGRQDDTQAFHELRTQWDVMKHSSKYAIDANMEETRTWMRRLMWMKSNDEEQNVAAASPPPPSPTTTESAGVTAMTMTAEITKVQKPEQQGSTTDDNDRLKGEEIRELNSYSFAIIWRFDNDDDTQPAATDNNSNNKISNSKSPKEQLIGSLGIHTINPSNEFGYMIRKEYWGRGVVTACAQAFLKEWWSLPRTKTMMVEEKYALELLSKIGNPSTTLPSLSNAISHDNGSNSDTDSSRETKIHIPETVTAVIERGNKASHNIARKLGMIHHAVSTDNVKAIDWTLDHYWIVQPEFSSFSSSSSLLSTS